MGSLGSGVCKVTKPLKRMDEAIFGLVVVTACLKRMKGTGGLVRFGLLLVT